MIDQNYSWSTEELLLVKVKSCNSCFSLLFIYVLLDHCRSKDLKEEPPPRGAEFLWRGETSCVNHYILISPFPLLSFLLQLSNTSFTSVSFSTPQVFPLGLSWEDGITGRLRGRCAFIAAKDREDAEVKWQKRAKFGTDEALKGKNKIKAGGQECEYVEVQKAPGSRLALAG